jgi:hypothetical protein
VDVHDSLLIIIASGYCVADMEMNKFEKKKWMQITAEYLLQL